MYSYFRNPTNKQAKPPANKTDWHVWGMHFLCCCCWRSLCNIVLYLYSTVLSEQLGVLQIVSVPGTIDVKKFGRQILVMHSTTVVLTNIQEFKISLESFGTTVQVIWSDRSVGSVNTKKVVSVSLGTTVPPFRLLARWWKNNNNNGDHNHHHHRNGRGDSRSCR